MLFCILQILLRYDLILIQEIRDSEEKWTQELLNVLNGKVSELSCVFVPIKAAIADRKKVVNGTLFFSVHVFLCVHLMLSG